ncbi:hypothetical protein EDF24_1051 [Curtobacterium sp. PhB130]|uniref:hypothetical protein n=1 Tax=Curtobacterium sp. PhB130 TaxID=2485178 RepID=UPI000F4C0E3A|nr:hypothetical protein [Curtobacterium sp. PhB130]ROS78277.1 hypothetical protein EDF24_1051 [Curtobacterium sp. PhB130]
MKRAERALLRGLLRRLVLVGVTVTVLATTTDWIAAHLVAPLFSYSGFTHVVAPWPARLVVVALTIGVAMCLPATIRRASHVVLWTIFVVCVAPAMLMSPSTGYLSIGTALALSATIGASFAVVGASFAVCGASAARSVPTSDGPERDVIRLGARSVDRGALTWTVCAAYSALTYAVMTATVGVHVRFLALDDIYDVRAAYTADVGSGGTLGYLLTGQAYVVNPLLLARGIARRRPALVVLASAGQFLLYSSTGFKAVLFSFVAVLGVALLFRGRAQRASLSFLVAPIAIMIVSAVADALQGGITWTSVFTRRFMLTPGLLTSVYVQFFSDNPVAGYGYSFLRTWVDYPYDLPPPKRIAAFLVPGSNGYANANLFADGFANLGWVGIPVAAAALFVWLRFLDRAAAGLPLRVAAMTVVMPSIMLSNTSVFTAMLSHGLLVGTVILAIAPRSGWDGQPVPPSSERRRSASPSRRDRQSSR